ncbi:MAG: type II toxin-antitoxin system HipA family toxin, partial [Janthinobacterium lividum]
MKNIGLFYPDGRTPEFSPAYDIVAYAAFHHSSGHALMIVPPQLLRKGPRPHPGRSRQALSP